MIKLKKKCTLITLVLLLFLGVMTGCSEKSDIGNTEVETSNFGTAVTEAEERQSGKESVVQSDAGFLPENVPAYSNSPYAVINNNKPYFTSSELTTVAFEKYSDLDSLGRCGVAVACIDKSLMPTGERGNIGQIYPTGWKLVKYDCVSGNYLYNRCHLISWQLTGENANTKNLITGTRYLNVNGMLPFENMVADYVKETDNHVMYRVTPVFEGNNLLASGVLMEAKSVEDNGSGIEFCVFCYNVQPGVKITYSTGDSELEQTQVPTQSQTEDNTGDEGKTQDKNNDSISAADAVTDMKIGWNLGNTLDSTGDWINLYTDRSTDAFETAWGNPVASSELIKHISDLGYGAVRLPVTWNYHFDENGNIDTKWLNRVTELVDEVLKNDMYCIINLHHDTGTDGWLKASSNNYNTNNAKFVKLWAQISTHFKDYPYELMFEGFNEMLDENSNWNNPGKDALNAVNMYNQSFVDCVRKTGGKNGTRNLIVNTYAAASDNDVLSGFVIPKDTVDDHLIVQVHSYEPWSFTSTTATWTQMTSTFGEKEQADIDNKLTLINTLLLSKNIPVIIGEFGSENKNNTGEREKWAAYMVSRAKSYGITCFVWDNGAKDSMGLVDRNMENDMFPSIIDAMVNAVK